VTIADSTVRPDALDYLSGLTLQPADLPPQSAWQAVPALARRLELVHGVGFQASAEPKDQPASFATEALLAGMAGERIPFAFQVVGLPDDGVRFMVGTWSDDGSYLSEQHRVVQSLLDGLYPWIGREEAAAVDVSELTVGGIAQGVPVAEVRNGEAPWDRLLRAMQGARFSVLVLAEPVEPETIAQLRDIALDDVRAALAAEDRNTQTPLTRAHATQMDQLVDSLSRALAGGAWRTGIYLLGDEASYWRLAAAWRGTFSEPGAAGLPLQVAASRKAAALAAGWVLPYRPAPAGPRAWQHPFMNQTLLDSRQLATCAHFPRHDSPGFSVRPAPTFAVSHEPPATASRLIDIGDVLAQQRKTGTTYRVDVDQLSRHIFVAGLTGSGKTNTLMHLLAEAADLDVPFLVIEPAKTEYRELLGREGLKGRLRVFTLGREQVAPLRINPFEVPVGIDVSTHLDLLKAVFMASFAMWIPLPQVLEQCLVQLYTERGWDFASGDRQGGRAGDGTDVPRMGELVEVVERSVPTLGYKPETTQEISASLTTRLNALRRGTRGLMLDVERSIPIDELLRQPTIIELEGLGDDADKAFVMGLLLVRLYEHRRAENAARLAAAAAEGKPAPPSARLAHIVVMEEAHRLLAQSKGPVDSWHADPQGAFADAFSQMLSEIRAYGQALVIADQVPVRLAPDVVKNTNLKIVHRLVAADDRETMAGAMSMNADQANLLSVLPPGRAAIFSEGDHTPVIVDVKKAKNLDDAPAIDDVAVAKAMAAWRADPAIAPNFSQDQWCADVCPTPKKCREATAMAEEPDGRLLAGRLFNSAVADPAGVDAVWPDVVAYVAARTPNNEALDPRVHSFAMHALHVAIARRAIQGGWDADSVAKLAAAARDLVAERVDASERWLGATRARQALCQSASALMRRTHDPYPLCPAICGDETCRFRDTLVDALTHPRHARYSADTAGLDNPAAYVLQVATLAANDVITTAADAPTGDDELNSARWRAVGCAAQVKFCGTDHPREAASLVAEALTSAGWSVALDDRTNELANLPNKDTNLSKKER
jgi:hypothetical protein